MIDIERQDGDFNISYIESSLFNQKIEVWIQNTVDMKYAEKCVLDFLHFDDVVMDEIREKVFHYYEYMMEIMDDDFVDEVNQIIPSNVSQKDILKYVDNPLIFIFPPKGSGVGYKIVGECEWEPEHGIDIIILNGQVMDVGPQDELNPWTNFDELERLF